MINQAQPQEDFMAVCYRRGATCVKVALLAAAASGLYFALTQYSQGDVFCPSCILKDKIIDVIYP